MDIYKNKTNTTHTYSYQRKFIVGLCNWRLGRLIMVIYTEDTEDLVAAQSWMLDASKQRNQRYCPNKGFKGEEADR